RLSILQTLSLVGTLAAFLIVLPAFAQQTGEQPASPPEATKPEASKPMPIQQSQPTTVPGRPDIPNAEVNKVLRGVPAPPFPTAEDKLPIPQLKLPKGFKVEIYASGIPNARSLRLGDKGTVFVSNRILAKISATLDTNRQRQTTTI